MNTNSGLILLFIFCFGWNCKGFAEASCNPACQNDGRCIQPENVCECPVEFRGKYCQYPASACDATKLDLTNQISSCASSDETLDCIISCPDGFEFQTKPAHVYSCFYKEGTFSGTPPRCVRQCKNGAKLLECAPNGQPDCQGKETRRPAGNCVEDCYCPEGTFKEKDQCVQKNRCSCMKDGVVVPIGVSINVECNTCICKEGRKLVCTTKNCGSSCSAYAHYTDFNGIRFDNMGKCSYYFLITETFTIEGENGGIDANANFVPPTFPDYANRPSSLKSVTVRTLLYNITIGQKQVVTVNDNTVVDLPTVLGNMKIRRISSEFIAVEFGSGVSVQFDGRRLGYVNVPYAFKGRTRGICGTFGGNDSLLMKDIAEYAELWKTDSNCDSSSGIEKHPCKVYPERKPEAERLCSKLTGDVFSACVGAISPDIAYTQCLYHVCASGDNARMTFCTDASIYAKECAAKGVQIDWRDRIEECVIECPGGQVYKVCHSACKRTCEDITLNRDCANQCTEGCNCPEGQAFDSLDRCIPVDECPCTFDGSVFTKGFRRRKDEEVCVCDAGLWMCEEEPVDVINNLPDCDARNLTLVHFIPVASKTCKNMHEAPIRLPGASCICSNGTVFGEDEVCIPAEECPCYYSGRSYEEGSVVNKHCEQCTCSNNEWVCAKQPCLGQCNVWGQGHYQTFDGTTFDFQGICEYVLSAGSQLGRSYKITTKYSRAGSTITLQTITIQVTVNERTETLILHSNQTIYPVPRYREIVVYDSVALVEVESPLIGLRVQWDRGNGLYVKVESSWQRDVRGICGNYDNDDDDTTVNLTWQSGDDCSEPTPIQMDCLFGRMQTALRNCRILKSELFATCNQVVNPEDYMAKCINDLCQLCDDSDDNTALCPVLAAYNQECLNQGVIINWRSNELCPLQCGPNEKLISTGRCPVESCEDVSNTKNLCRIDTDHEACVTSNECPDNSVLASRWSDECVPKLACKVVCLQLKDATYYEGDVMETVGDTVCRCVNGRKVCD